jgi:hypothetical protein
MIMKKHMTDYLDEVCKSIKGRELRQTARSELAVHMSERYGELESDGLEADAAALETVKRMGDAETLGRRITAANRSFKGLINAFIGFVFFIFAISLFGIIDGVEFLWFVDFVSFAQIIVLTAAYAFLCCGRRLTLLRFINHFKNGALYASGISLIALLMILFQMMGGSPEETGYRLATALTSPLYGLLLSAAARIAESRLPAPEEGAIRDLLE